MDAYAESSLEHSFLRWLDEQGLRLPDRAQVLVPEASARPDLVYELPSTRVAVFIDGPHHDAEHVRERDESAEERLLDAGWMVVRVRHDDDWGSVVSRYPSVFGA